MTIIDLRIEAAGIEDIQGWGAVNRWPDQWTGRPRELRCCWAKYQSALEGCHRGWGVEHRGLVRILLILPNGAQMRQIEDEVIPGGEVSEPRGQGVKDHWCVYWNDGKIRPESSEKEPGAKIIKKWGGYDLGIMTWAWTQGIRRSKVMTGDLKLGLYSRAKVNYIAMPPLLKSVSGKADTFRISY